MSLDKLRMVFGELTAMAQWDRQGTNFDDRGAIELGYEDEDKKDLPTIKMQYLEDDDSLLIFCETGPLPTSLEVQVLRELLERQYLFQNGPGVTFAMAPDTLALTAQMKLAVEPLTPNDLGNVLMGFDEELLELWHMVERYAGLSRADPQAMPV